MEIEYTRKKLNKFESLKPVLKLLESLLVSHGMGAQDAGMVVLDLSAAMATKDMLIKQGILPTDIVK